MLSREEGEQQWQGLSGDSIEGFIEGWRINFRNISPVEFEKQFAKVVNQKVDTLYPLDEEGRFESKEIGQYLEWYLTEYRKLHSQKPSDQ